MGFWRQTVWIATSRDQNTQAITVGYLGLSGLAGRYWKLPQFSAAAVVVITSNQCQISRYLSVKFRMERNGTFQGFRRYFFSHLGNLCTHEIVPELPRPFFFVSCQVHPWETH
ncbi:hypothetical protein VTN00DRAFT_7247 [Thermoascus crustaceus]|uniref:uncharacterized protein n=1 Tax=Thermoascus crustaceus TaxID=5088 RepID=UPI0037447AFB